MAFEWLAQGVQPVQLADPMRLAAQGMSLADLARRNRQGEEDEQFKALERQANMLAAQGYAKAQQGGDINSVLSELAGQGEAGALAAQKLAKARRDNEIADADLANKKSTTAKNYAEADDKVFQKKIKGFGDIANAASGGADMRLLQSMSDFYGIPLPAMPQGMDEATYRTGLADTALSAKDRLLNDTTISGQDMQDNRARELAQITDARQRELAAAQRDQASATRDQARATAQGPISERTSGFRKEFANLPEVKNYKDIAPILEAVRKAPNTPQGDLQLIYGVGKIMDPGSVVREGEMGLVIKSGSPQERLQGFISYLQGGGQLTPGARARLYAVLEGAVGERKAQYDAARQAYTGIAQRGGVLPEDVFVDIPSGGGNGGGALQMVNGVKTYVPNAR